MVIGRRLKGDPAWFRQAFRNKNQAVVIIPLMYKTESLLLAV
jgi:hypothetical protein